MPRIRDFKKVGTSSKDLAKLQDNLEEFIKPLVLSSIIDGVLLKDLKLVSGLNAINHKLNRKPEGWIVVKSDANATFWQSVSELEKQILNLNSSAAATVSLWVF